jgi:N-acetylmuramoyl-L-alanine amidase
VKLRRADRKEHKIKSDMLKEVFEENLRIAGKSEGNRRKRRRKLDIGIASSLTFLSISGYILFNYIIPREQPRPQVIQPAFFKTAGAARASSPGYSGPGTVSPAPLISLAPSRYTAFLTELQMPLRKIFGLKVKRILIDPGHGGEYPGTIGKSGLKEKDLTLDIGLRLRERLKKYGKYQVLMTREEDITLSLDDRVAFANSSKADLFISIHLNYFPNKPVNIIETFYFGPHTDRQDLLLAEKENIETESTVKDFKEIIRNIENRLKTQESNSLAFFIQKSLYRNIHRQNQASRNLGIKTAPFIVLLGVDVPSVLTEVTCLSHSGEEEKLARPDYREKIAGYLEEGIVNYLNKTPE